MSGPTHMAGRNMDGIITVSNYDRGRGRKALERAQHLAKHGERVELVSVSDYGLYTFRAVSIVDEAREAHPDAQAIFPAADGMSAAVKVKGAMILVSAEGKAVKTYREGVN